MIDIIIFALAGIVLGTMTGLIPGLHVNTVVLVLVGFVVFIDPILIIAAIMATAITHTLWDFVPSILLGVPDQSTALSVLPGHKLLLDGRGAEAIYLTLVGGVYTMLISTLALPFLLVIIPLAYGTIHTNIHYVLIVIALIVIFTEKGNMKKLYASMCFILSGTLGFMLFNMFTISSHQPIALPGSASNSMFFPLFTGLFGLSTLIISLNKRRKMPEQYMHITKVNNGLAMSGAIKSFFSGILVGTLPGIGSAQASVLAQQITRKNSNDEFLVTLGGINTVVALFSMVSLYTISRPRSGAAIAVDAILGSFGQDELLLLTGISLLATGITALIILKTIRPTIRLLGRFDYYKINMSIILLLIALVIVFTGTDGLIILFASTSIGLLAPLLGVKRSNLMGALMLPLILFYAGV